MPFSGLFETLQEEALPGIWSKGVAMARAPSSFTIDKNTPDELIVRVMISDRAAKPKVTLWLADEDSYCDCGERVEPCAHIVAVAVAKKNGILEKAASSPERPAAGSAPQIVYTLMETEGTVRMIRKLRGSEGDQRLKENLVAYLGGIQSGRIKEVPPASSQEDLQIDRALGPHVDIRGWSTLAPSSDDPLPVVMKALETCPLVFWNNGAEDKPIQIHSKVLRARILIEKHGKGFAVKWEKPSTIHKPLPGGLVLVQENGQLFLQRFHAPSIPARSEYTQETEIHRLVTELIPALEKSATLEGDVASLPRRVEDESPRVIYHMESHIVSRPGEAGPGQGSVLTVLPRIVYGNPPIAEAEGVRLKSLDPTACVVRDLAAEKALIRTLQTQWHLVPGNASRFEGAQAVQMRSKLEAEAAKTANEIGGRGSQEFSNAGALLPRIHWYGDQPEIQFKLEAQESRQASSSAVWEAWTSGNPFVRLLDGGWAKLPQDWLTKYGPKLRALLDAKNTKPTAATRLELVSLTKEMGEAPPVSLQELHDRLDSKAGIPAAKLPSDLRAELRSYQRSGVDWLTLMRESKLGALLADDMGLGKTLQALASLPESGKGTTLIICPTSVLHNWSEQIAKFRPGLKALVHHGGSRRLPSIRPDVVVTSYGVARQDLEELAALHWDGLIADEAQNLKNPDSQVAQALHRLALKADFRFALSGTPVENRVDDLWSQFQVLNPGWLGARTAFKDDVSRDLQATRQRLRPFLLRRLKKDVAKELPPRTETVLYCELDESERGLYDSVLASTRTQILKELDQGGGVMSALEALLRLRQICCSPELLPGGGSGANASSKLRLLIESLETSIDAGHRALVFSQWTSYLDLIERELSKRGIRYSRLDGSTRDRAGVVEEFQNEGGPEVMLLSLKAGGVGITLTAADHIYLTDPWWNPAVEDQAADRAHRIGQTQPVLIHRLVAENTVEERVLALQAQKLALAASLLEGATPAGTAAGSGLTRDDILGLLS